MMKARLLESSPGLYSKSHRLGYISTGQNKNILMDYIPPNWYLKKTADHDEWAIKHCDIIISIIQRFPTPSLEFQAVAEVGPVTLTIW